MYRRQTLILWLLVIASPPGYAESWPTWQHDNRRTGTTSEQLQVEALQIDWTWQSASPPQTAWAGPAKYDAYAFHRNLPSMRNYDSVFHLIAVGNRIWFGSSVDDSVVCLNARDGRVNWVVTTDGPVRLAPTWSEGRVYFGSDDGYARCVDASDGRLIWKLRPAQSDRLVLNNGRWISFQPCRTGVVVDDKTAWFACAMLPWKDSFLCAVDSRTGKTTSPEHYIQTLPGRTMEGVPALSSDALILPQGRVAPRVFDRHTGADLGDMAKSGGGSVVVVTLEADVLHGPGSDSRKGGFRQSAGQSRELVAALGRGNALVVDGDQAWMLTDDAIVASSLSAQQEQWKAACDCPFTMIKAGDTLFVGGDQQVAAYSAKDGTRLWQRAASGRVFGLVAAEGRLFASSDTGVIHCYSPDGRPSQSASPERVATEAANTDLADVTAIDDDRLLGHWAFQPSSSLANEIVALRGPNLTLAGPGSFSRLGNYHALELDGKHQSAMVSPTFQRVPHPQKAFTAEAWVRIDQLQHWGGILGIIQDDGSKENGWLLGYRKDRFCIAVRALGGPAALTYLSSEEPFELARWYHVAGSYDGKVMRLLVDGQVVAESDQQSGNIAYPDRAWFEIGAYHDQDEYFRMSGAIHETRLYSHALSVKEIQQHFDQTRSRIPATRETIELSSGPWLTFDDPQTATVRWTSRRPQPTRLQYGTATFDRMFVDDTLKTEHRAVLENLERNRVYQYRIGEPHDGAIRFTEAMECDNFFNFSPPAASRIPAAVRRSSEPLVDQLLSQSSCRRGLCLVMGELDADVLVQFCRQSELRFVVAMTDPRAVDRTRSALRADGVYGNQVAVQLVTDLSKLPFPGNWANLVLVTDLTAAPDVIREARRQTRPNGGVTMVRKADAKEIPPRFTAIENNAGVIYCRCLKPALPGSADWSHLYASPDNSAFGGEQLAGAKTSDDLEVQWVGRPGPRYQADRSGRKPSPLAIDGRLFLQGLNRIIAVDSFNGTILWSLEIPGFERFNMPRDCSNWCGNADHLFAVVGRECWKISTDTGEVVSRVQAAERDSVPMDWGYVATDGGRLFGSSVRPGASWTSFWGGGDAGWYDARSGAVTFPICSDEVFCRSIDSMTSMWTYKRGLILNPTITVSNDTMYFVESRSSRVLAADERRVGDPDLWKQLYLVAVDSYTGMQKWDQELPPMEPQVVFYLAHSADQLTLASSSNQAFRVTSFSAHDGSKRWTQSIPWAGGKGDHGKAMMRPAIVGDRIFLRPHVLSLKDGAVLPQKMPDGHGCGTYACTADAIFYRASTVTMWDPDSDRKSSWSRLRPDCWLSTIPASGMLLSPEGGGGCSCGSWMETSIGFMPRAFDSVSSIDQDRP